MKLTETQKLGLIATLGAFAEAEDSVDYFLQAGKSVASDYLDMTENQQEQLLQLAKEGLATLNKLAEDNL